MEMANPPHPGETVRELCLIPLDLTVTDAAKVLRVSRQSLSELVNGRSGISPEMAIRLEKGFGGTARSWVQQQAEYDLWKAQQSAEDIDVVRYVSA